MLLVLNIGYIVVMLVVIAITGAPKTKYLTCSAAAIVKTTSSKSKSVSGLSNGQAFRHCPCGAVAEQLEHIKAR